MDAIASEISLVDRSSRCAIHIFTQTRFLEVTFCFCQLCENKGGDIRLIIQLDNDAFHKNLFWFMELGILNCMSLIVAFKATPHNYAMTIRIRSTLSECLYQP